MRADRGGAGPISDLESGPCGAAAPSAADSGSRAPKPGEEVRLTAEEQARLASLLPPAAIDPVWHRSPDDWWRRLVLRLSGGRAVTLGRHIFLPDNCVRDLAVWAHELVHVGQYRRWGPLVYYSRGAACQARYWLHRAGLARDPYEWRSLAERRFDQYGMEQQAQLVEDAFRGDALAARTVGGRADPPA